MTLEELKAQATLPAEIRAEMVKAEAESDDEDEYDPESDLSEALTLLGDCQSVLEMVLKRYTRRKKMSTEELRDVKKLAIEVNAILAQYET